MPIPGARYVHTNLVARDWRALARFYEEVLGCTPVPPERDYRGPDLEAGSGVPGARLQGVHLRLPGGGPDGPTLEIYQYSVMAPASPAAPNRPGFGHIAFTVPSVPGARGEFLARGGTPVGEVVTSTTGTGDHVTWCYVRDPEGNIVELQAWG